jgi:hypothetical protein
MKVINKFVKKKICNKFKKNNNNKELYKKKKELENQLKNLILTIEVVLRKGNRIHSILILIIIIN